MRRWIPSAAFDSDAAAYIAARPSLSAAEQRAVNYFVQDLKAYGIWANRAQIGILTAGSFSDVFAANLKGPTSTNHSFVSGDFSNTINDWGLIGDASSKYVDTGYLNDGITLNDSASTAYIFFGASGAYADLVWGRAGFATLGLFANFVGTSYGFAGDVGANVAAPTGAPVGHWVVDRTTSTRVDLYLNGTSIANSTSANSGSLTAGETGLVFAIRTAALGVSSHSPSRIALWSVGSSMTSQQVTDFLRICNNFLSRLAPYTGPFIYPYFVGDGSANEQIHMAQSVDGVTWTLMAGWLTPTVGTFRDPSLLLASDGNLFVAYTSGSFGTSTSFGVAVGNLANRNFVTVANVDCSSITGITQCWGPKYYTDPADGTHHILFSASVSGTSGPFAVYEVHPTNDAQTTWSTPVALTGTSLRSNIFDSFMFFLTSDPGRYYIIYKDEDTKYLEIMRSTSPLSGYTIWKDAATLGMDQNIEGPSVADLGTGDQRIYADYYLAGTGMHYVDTSTFSAVGTGTPITISGPTRNGVFLRTSGP